jgi:hypothetical protein
MKNISKILIIAFALSILIGIQSVYAIPTLQLKSGATTKTIADGSILDANSEAGVVTYIGAVGIFNLNVTTGVTKPALGSATLPDLDLNSVDLNSSGAGTLKILFTDDNFGPYTGGFLFNVGGTTNNNTVGFKAYVDSVQIVDLGTFGGSGSQAFSGSGSGGNGVYLNPFTLTTEATITTTGRSNVSFDAELVTPEPSTIMLLGSGLIGAAIYARRRKIK